MTAKDNPNVCSKGADSVYTATTGQVIVIAPLILQSTEAGRFSFYLESAITTNNASCGTLKTHRFIVAYASMN